MAVLARRVVRHPSAVEQSVGADVEELLKVVWAG
jgi:hypothetical protein